MSGIGILTKMFVEPTTPVNYFLRLSEKKIALNPFLGKKIKLSFTGKIQCMGCARSIKKSYQDGYCFPCTQKLARCDFCILKPERCHYHLGTCREPKWGEEHCMIPHFVYLANASGLKVGITRHTQIPTRWIDQGAMTALPIFRVATRRISGFVEVALAQFISDKTNWRKMLTAYPENLDLYEEARKIKPALQLPLQKIQKEWGEQAVEELNESVVEFSYPILSYPTKITSLSFSKQATIEGQLLGIKGQYLILDSGVLNIRKHSGYEIDFITC